MFNYFVFEKGKYKPEPDTWYLIANMWFCVDAVKFIKCMKSDNYFDNDYILLYFDTLKNEYVEVAVNKR